MFKGFWMGPVEWRMARSEAVCCCGLEQRQGGDSCGNLDTFRQGFPIALCLCLHVRD